MPSPSSPLQDDSECPAGDMYDTIHRRCAPADSVCFGAPNGTVCSAANVAGTCTGGICLASNCGNNVVEPGEECDDGNHMSHDGCDSNCQIETSQWTLVPLTPHCLSRAFDTTRSMYVCVTVD